MRGHGEGSITHRKDGRWQCQISIGGGERKTLYGKTKKEVQEKLRLAINEQKQGVLSTGPQQTLEAYIRRWVEDVYKPSVRPSTYVQCCWAVRRYIVPILGRITLQKLTPEKIQAFHARLLEGGLKPSSVGVIHAFLHRALDDAVRWGLIGRNVSSLVSLPRVEEKDIQTLTSEQSRELIDTAKGYRIETFIILALATGARHGELLSLRWEDVDLERAVMHIRHTMHRVSGYGYVENTPKTKSGRRMVTLPDFAVEALRLHRVSQDAYRVAVGDKWVNNNLLFTSIHGGFLNPDTVRRWFRVILKAAGLPVKTRVHDLRHSMATLLFAVGVHPKIVQERLGHSKISMTLDMYSHVLPSMQEDAANKINDLLKGS